MIRSKRRLNSKLELAIGFIGVLVMIFLSGCAGSEKKSAAVATKPSLGPDGQPIVKFSEYPQNPVVPQRQFKRMTKQRLEEESEIQASAGSMWVMEGQGAYLFTQNKTRKEGDLLSVKMEGAAQKQVETKVAVIKKLLRQLEDEESRRKSEEQQKQNSNSTESGKLADAKTGADPAAAATPTRAPASDAAAKDDKDEPLDLSVVPTRITEKMGDGNYRVKGQQSFMIGKREYKVIVTGLIRPEDFNDEGVGSNRLLEAQYDVVSLRRKEAQ